MLGKMWKAFTRSKTIFFNTATGAVAAVGLALPEFREALTPLHYALLFLGYSAVNNWLRSVTTKPLSEK